MDDRQLLRQLQKKSRGALEAAIAQYGAYVLAIIRNRSRGVLTPDREIFYRFYDLSQTTAQIADALHLNASTVRSRLMRGRETLRKLLSKGGLFHEDDVG